MTTTSLPRPNRRAMPRFSSLLAVGGLFILAAVVVMPWDVAIASWVRELSIGGDLRRLIHLSETFAYGLTVILILLAIHAADLSARRALPRVVAVVFGAGLAANLVKCSLARFRPMAMPPDLDSWQTFVGWLPAVRAGGWDMKWNHDLQSFPSSHTAVAVGLAIALGQLYPRGRMWFAWFAAMAGFQRLYAGAHFLSDVLLAAGLSCLLAVALRADRIRRDSVFRPSLG